MCVSGGMLGRAYTSVLSWSFVDYRVPVCSCKRCTNACRYEFLAREQEVAALQELTLDKLHGAFAELFLPGSPQRRKLAVHVIGKSHAAELTAAVPEGVERVEDLPGLQQRLGAWPTVVGVTPTIAGVLG